MELEQIVEMTTEKSLNTARRMLMARMETGDHTSARALLAEIYAVNAEVGQGLRLELIEAYNTDLL